ncbi:hypothetical protein Swit_3999 [Rhizorhabdus wittichii RW1]|uniref:Papain-like cysteine peptidase n=1 Tax=Rhizorhabdus wittichii (strain DSM 6014 / CCUG 31198 / JCM 15750 / NBRC 105917 / EY 4224 / RW1) TaxID=392499 RepID=A0A9J9HF68_RHIWR|nr:hypothetical protein Swit_3999 [Rhizorhabdus wittichii RW1]
MSAEARWDAPRSYDSVLSIGAQCLTSTMLKAAGLKRYSAPFDWIFSNLRMVSDCIEDDFAVFLDRRHLKPVPVEQRHTADSCFADHDHYRRRYGLNTMFNHYDPVSAEGYAYLERCVARFRAALASGRPHLLLAIAERYQGGWFGFDRLCAALDSYPAIELLVLISPERRAPQGLELWEQRGRHRLAYLHTPSPVAGIHFEAEEDNIFLGETLRRLIALNR